MRIFASARFGVMKKARYRVLMLKGEEKGFQLFCMRKSFFYYSWAVDLFMIRKGWIFALHGSDSSFSNG